MPAPLYDKNCPLAREGSAKNGFYHCLLKRPRMRPRTSTAREARSVSPLPLRNSCDFFLRRAMNILRGLPFIIVRIIVPVIIVRPRCIWIWWLELLNVDLPEAPRWFWYRMALPAESYVKFPWLSHPIMSPREEGKKGHFLLHSPIWSTSLRRHLCQLDLVSIVLWVIMGFLHEIVIFSNLDYLPWGTKFLREFNLRIAVFSCFAGTNFCD